MRTDVFKSSSYLVVACLDKYEEYAFYLYRDEEVLERTPYSASQAYVFEIADPGIYQVKIFGIDLQGIKSRTWSKKLLFGVQDLVSAGREVALDPQRESWDDWLVELTERDFRKGGEWFILEQKPYTAERIMTVGWQLAQYPALNPASDIDWGKPGMENRSWGFHLHAWEFIDPVMKKYVETRDPELLDWMLTAAMKWWNFAQNDTDEEAMVWYDMSLSLRAPRLARLVELVAKTHSPERALTLFDAVIRHIEKLFLNEAFNPNNNHGFFAAAASVDLAKYLPMFPATVELLELGTTRMKIMVDRQFAPDGGHLEHSPDYHRMLLGSFEKGIRAGLIEDEQVGERIAKAAHVLGWMIQPDGHLVQFGDSPSFDVDNAALESVDVNTEFLLSDGHRGEPNGKELCVLPDSGYAFVRSPQPSSEGQRMSSSYLAFLAGFHSRAHKHADDLTFTWFDRGREIIVDSGRYGYEQLLPADAPERLDGFYYGAPERMYVEGTIAHNTVSVDGRNIERRERQPYGSALGKCTKTGEHFILRGTVDHGTYLHERMLRFQPSVSLEVIDTLTPSSAKLEATAWFNVDGSFDISTEGNDLLMHSPDGAFLIRVQSDGELIIPVKGQQSPMRGWRSRVDRVLEPVWNYGFSQRVDKRTRQTTRFTFENTSDARRDYAPRRLVS